MSKHISVALFVPILFYIFFTLLSYKIEVNEKSDFERLVFERLSNYAADAAVEELLYTGDLGMDYADNHKDVQPDLAVREYCSMMLLGMGMQTTDENISWFQNHHLKTMIVCAYDGFYVYQHDKVYTGEYTLVSTPKIPYFYTSENNTQYVINLGLEQGRCDWADETEGRYRVNALDDLPAEVTVDRQLTAINNQVSRYLQYAVSRAYGGHENKNYAIPAFASEISGAQPINNITVIGVVDTDDKRQLSPNLCMSIGGARIVESDPILGFRIGNTKYYGHQSKLQAYHVDPSSITKQFNSVYDAASEGYNFYLPAYE